MYEDQSKKSLERGGDGANPMLWAIGFIAAIVFLMAAVDGSLGAGLAVGLVTFLAITGYLLPSIVAVKRDKHNALAIIWLNVLLGWTLVGWVVAMVWAVTKDTVLTAQVPASPASPLFKYDYSAKPAAPAGPDVKICPFCAEEVRAAALKCKHCGSDLTSV